MNRQVTCVVSVILSPVGDLGRREELLAAAAGLERATVKQPVFSLTPRFNDYELQMGTGHSPCT